MGHKSTWLQTSFPFPIALLWFQSSALGNPNCIHYIPYLHGTFSALAHALAQSLLTRTEIRVFVFSGDIEKSSNTGSTSPRGCHRWLLSNDPVPASLCSLPT